MLDLATSVAEPSVDVTWCFYAREEIGRDDSGLEQLWRTGPSCSPVMRPSWVSRPVHWSRPAVRARCASASPSKECGPTRLAPSRAQRHSPARGTDRCRRRLGRSRGRARRLRLRRATPGRGGRGRCCRQRRTGPGPPSITATRRTGARRRRERSCASCRGPSSSRGRLGARRRQRWCATSLAHPLLAALVARSAAAPKAKVGWTDVASFWEHGVPAANFGPGDPLLAHHPEERVTRAQLERAYQVLHAVIT